MRQRKVGKGLLNQEDDNSVCVPEEWRQRKYKCRCQNSLIHVKHFVSKCCILISFVFHSVLETHTKSVDLLFFLYLNTFEQLRNNQRKNVGLTVNNFKQEREYMSEIPECQDTHQTLCLLETPCSFLLRDEIAFRIQHMHCHFKKCQNQISILQDELKDWYSD